MTTPAPKPKQPDPFAATRDRIYKELLSKGCTTAMARQAVATMTPELLRIRSKETQTARKGK